MSDPHFDYGNFPLLNPKNAKHKANCTEFAPCISMDDFLGINRYAILNDYAGYAYDLYADVLGHKESGLPQQKPREEMNRK